MFMKLISKPELHSKISIKTTPEDNQSAVKPVVTKQSTLVSKSQQLILKPTTVISAKPTSKRQLIEIQDVQIIRPATVPTQQLKLVPLNSQKVLIPMSSKVSQQPIKITNIVTVPTITTNIVTSVKQTRPQVTVVKVPHTKPAELKKRSSGISLQISKPESFTHKDTGCIVCKTHTKNKTNFCSDECVRKYVILATPKAVRSDDEIANKKAKKNLFEDLLSSADSKPKFDRVCVYEKSTGQILTGANAPLLTNLKKWLQDHPTFEIVQNGTHQALEVEVSYKNHFITSEKI